MYTCDQCTDLLFDHLYGLLEAEEAQVVRAHLVACPACQAALTEAEAQQKLLTKAAQVYTQLPAFVAPAAESYPQATTTLPLPTQRRVRLWPALSAAVAAALLLSAGVLYHLYQTGLSARQQDLAEARQHVLDIDAQFARAMRTYEEESAALPAKLQGQHLYLQVFGPTVYQPGAATPYRGVLKNLQDQPTLGSVTVRLVSEAGEKPLFEKKHLSAAGELAFALPPGLKFGPGAAARLEVEADDSQAGAVLRQELLAGEPAYLTHVALDKSVYRVGEVLFFRTLTLERFSLQPPNRAFQLSYSLRNAQGRQVKKLQGESRPDGIGGGEFALTSDLVDGEYTLLVAASGANSKHFQPQMQRLLILRQQPPELEFDRQQYRPNDTGIANFRGRRAGDGAPLANQPLQVEIKADGRSVDAKGGVAAAPLQMRTDLQGNAAIPFQLPSNMQSDKAQITVQYNDGKREEKLVQAIPVVGPQPRIEFFPEGGELVAGVPNRVYFRMTAAADEDAEVLGRVIDSGGNCCADFATAPAGAGLTPDQRLGVVFSFTPAKGETYRLQITAPDRLKTEAVLPQAADEGVVLSVRNGVSREGEPIRAVVRATGRDRPVLVLATCRGQVVDERFVLATSRGAEVPLTPVAGTRGVLRLTVYEPQQGQLVPLAERLVYQAPAERLQLSFTAVGPENQPLRPGASAQMTLKAVNEKGDLTQCLACAAVVDERRLETGDRRVAQGLPAFFYLTTAVPQGDSLDNADLLLGDGPEAREALDLFLGTHGWRRFVRPDTSSLLALRESKDSPTREEQPGIFNRDNLEAVQEGYAKALTQQQASLRRSTLDRREELQAEKEQRQRNTTLAATALAEYENRPREYLRLGLGLLVLLMVLVGLVCLLIGFVRLLRGRASPTPAFATAFTALALCLVVYGLTGELRLVEQRPGDETRQEMALSELPSLREPQQERRRPASAPSTPVGVFRGVDAQEKAPITRAGSEAEGASLAKKAEVLARQEFGTTPREAGRGPARDSVENRDLTRRFAYAQQQQDGMSGLGGGAHMRAMPSARPQSAAAPGPASPTTTASATGEQKTPLGAVPVLREYAHQHPRQGPDLQETVLWHPTLALPNGSAQVQFDLSDNVTTYRVLLYGHSPSGRLGFAQGRLEVRPVQK